MNGTLNWGKTIGSRRSNFCKNDGVYSIHRLVEKGKTECDRLNNRESDRCVQGRNRENRENRKNREMRFKNR